jgi:hypothetical protein
MSTPREKKHAFLDLNLHEGKCLISVNWQMF